MEIIPILDGYSIRMTRGRAIRNALVFLFAFGFGAAAGTGAVIVWAVKESVAQTQQNRIALNQMEVEANKIAREAATCAR